MNDMATYHATIRPEMKITQEAPILHMMTMLDNTILMIESDE